MGQCILEVFIYLLVVTIIASAGNPKKLSAHVITSLSVSSFGKLFTLVAIIWGGDWRRQMHIMISAYVVASNVVGLKAALQETRWGRAILSVVIGCIACEL